MSIRMQGKKTKEIYLNGVKVREVYLNGDLVYNNWKQNFDFDSNGNMLYINNQRFTKSKKTISGITRPKSESSYIFTSWPNSTGTLTTEFYNYGDLYIGSGTGKIKLLERQSFSYSYLNDSNRTVNGYGLSCPYEINSLTIERQNVVFDQHALNVYVQQDYLFPPVDTAMISLMLQNENNLKFTLKELKFKNVENIEFCATLDTGFTDSFQRIKGLTTVNLWGINLRTTYNNENVADAYWGSTMINSLFDGCFGLQKVYMGNVDVVGYGTFAQCASLREVHFPPSVQRIGQYAFLNSGIKSGSGTFYIYGNALQKKSVTAIECQTVYVEENSIYSSYAFTDTDDNYDKITKRSAFTGLTNISPINIYTFRAPANGKPVATNTNGEPIIIEGEYQYVENN